MEDSFKLKFDSLYKKAKSLAKKHLKGTTVRLPFVSFNVSAADPEVKVAREILIRLADKRVLNSNECCDNCIENSLASLQEIRRIIVDKQIELSNYHDGGVYLLLEFIVEAIRQSLFMEENWKYRKNHPGMSSGRPEYWDEYFKILKILRFHIHSCLKQLSILANIPTPKIEQYLASNEDWYLEAYRKPQNVSD